MAKQMFDIEMQDDLQIIRRKLGDMEKRAPNVAANALNRTLTTLKKHLSSRVPKEYTYKRKLQSPYAHRAKYSSMQAYLRYKPIARASISKIALTSFQHRKGSYGVPRNTPGKAFQAKIDRDGSFQPYYGAFAHSSDDTLARTTDERYPLRHAVGPTEGTMVKSVWRTSKTKRFASDTLSKKLDEQIENQYLKKWGLK